MTDTRRKPATKQSPRHAHVEVLKVNLQITVLIHRDGQPTQEASSEVITVTNIDWPNATQLVETWRSAAEQQLNQG